MRPITAADVMNPRVLAVQDNMTLEELASFLVENEISGAPVEDRLGRLVGVVSVTDVALAVAKGQELETHRTSADYFAREWEDTLTFRELQEFQLEEAEIRVAEIMTPSVHTVREDTPVPQLASLMIDSHIHRVLVTREDKVVGIVSTSDLLGLLVGDGER